jgi:hypothetical protein
MVATISSTAPFVGLLGTVLGIVTSFQAMASSGSGGLGTVSGGIAEALVTTAIGLLVAIPAVFAFNWMQSWVDARGVDLSESANELLEVVGRATATSAAPSHVSSVPPQYASEHQTVTQSGVAPAGTAMPAMPKVPGMPPLPSNLKVGGSR